MPTVFLDSSALVKAYRKEVGTSFVIDLLQRAGTVVISRLAQLEVSSAILRRGRDANLPSIELAGVLTELDREIVEAFDVIEVNESVMNESLRLIRIHALRGADGIQLACALHARTVAAEADFSFIASDRELSAAAVFEGLTVRDPTRH